MPGTLAGSTNNRMLKDPTVYGRGGPHRRGLKPCFQGGGQPRPSQTRARWAASRLVGAILAGALHAPAAVTFAPMAVALALGGPVYGRGDPCGRPGPWGVPGPFL